MGPCPTPIGLSHKAFQIAPLFEGLYVWILVLFCAVLFLCFNLLSSFTAYSHHLFGIERGNAAVK